MELDSELMIDSRSSAVSAGTVRRVLHSPDGQALLVAGTWSHISLWDISTSLEVASFKVASEWILDMAWKSFDDLQLLVVLGGDGLLSVFVCRSQPAIILEFQSSFLGHDVGRAYFGCLAANANHNNALMASTTGEDISVWHMLVPSSLTKYSVSMIVADGQPLLDKSRISHIVFLSSNHILVFLYREKKIVEFNTESGSFVREVTVPHQLFSVAASVEADTILAHDARTGAYFYSISQTLLHGATSLNLVAEKYAPVALCFSPCGGLAALGIGGAIHICSIVNKSITLVKTVETGGLRVFSIAIARLCAPFQYVRLSAAVVVGIQSNQRTWLLQVWDEHNNAQGYDQIRTARFNHLRRPSTPAIGTAQAILLRTEDGRLNTKPCNNEWCLQQETCLSLGWPLCLSCNRLQSAESVQGSSSEHPPVDEDCRFQGYRWRKDTGDLIFRFWDSLSEDRKALRLSYSNRSISVTGAQRDMVKLYVAQSLVRHLEAEVEHAALDNASYRPLSADTSYTCDVCWMGLSFHSWFCMNCGKELCGLCYLDLPNGSACDPCMETHCRSSFIPITHFSLDVLRNNISMMHSLLSCHTSNRPATALHVAEKSSRSALNSSLPMRCFSREEMTEKLLHELWETCEPFVLTGAISAAEPQDIFGLDVANPHACTTAYYDGHAWCEEKSTLEEYFASWEESSDFSRQVRDYPPESDLKHIHPKLHDTFLGILDSILDIQMGPRGAMNLCSYLPDGAIQPDLGPKLYISQAAKNTGTTFVHMDKSGAVNVMLFSQAESESRMGAHWDIWPNASVTSLSHALDPQTSLEECKLAQPIISELYYADDKVISAAFLDSGIRRWTHRQLPGEAVIIPPGCPHQVINSGHCVKIACDFVSPCHLDILEDLEQYFREINLRSRKRVHSDLLQIKNMMWHAWNRSS